MPVVSFEKSFSELKALLQAAPSHKANLNIRRLYHQLEKKHPQELKTRLQEDEQLENVTTRLSQQDDYVTVLNPNHYQALREAISQNRFVSTDDNPWPTATLGTESQAQLFPASLELKSKLAPEEVQVWSKLMWNQREQLSDLTVDVLDTLGAIWLKSAQSPSDDAIADLDSLLALRGLKPRLNRDGAARGYRESQRMEIFQSLIQIQNLWLTVGQIESYETTPKGRRKQKIKTIQSRAFLITDRLGQLRLDGCMDVEKFVFRPGKVFGQFLFGPGRQTALLSARALSYDPYREAWEKRLARYLSWHWKTNIIQGEYRYFVQSLLETIDPKLSSRSQRSQERLEKALDKLQSDSVIGNWSYCDPQQLELTLSPPFEEREIQALQSLPSAQLDESHPLSKLRKKRKDLKLSQADLAKQLGITQAYLSVLENRKTPKKLSSEVMKRIYNWIQES